MPTRNVPEHKWIDLYEINIYLSFLADKIS